MAHVTTLTPDAQVWQLLGLPVSSDAAPDGTGDSSCEEDRSAEARALDDFLL